VLAILLVAGFFVWQTNARQGGPSTPQVTVTRTLPTASRPSATSSAPTTTTTPVKIVTIVESDYVGVSVGLVRSDLTTIGFADIVTKEVASDKAKGIVLAVSPKGPVKVTEKIVLTVSSGVAPTSPATSTATTGGTGG
ncbi:MAG: PASTA domain-containing protein, partial [Candidatus Phosphoribacter sp.]